MIRILIIDEQKVIRKGLQFLLDSESDIEVLGTFGDGHAALEKIEHINLDILDIVIISKEIAESDEFAIVKKIRQQYAKVKIIIFSDRVDESNFVQSLALGVEGYILKNFSVDEIKDVIRHVNKGYIHLGNKVLETIVLPKLSKSCSAVSVKNLESEKSLAVQETPIIFDDKFQFKPFPENHDSHSLVINHYLSPENSSSASNSENISKISWRKMILSSLGLVSLGVTAIAVGFFSVKYSRGTEIVIKDAMINGEIISINSPAEGILKEVNYSQGKKVEANQVLAKIEPLKENKTEKIISQLKEDIDLKQQQINNAKKFLSFLETSLESLSQENKTSIRVSPDNRNNILDASFKANFAEQEKTDHFRKISNLDQQIINQKVTINLLGKELNNLQEKLINTKSNFINVPVTTITAPISGKINNLNYSSGEFIAPTKEIATIFNCQNLWVEAMIESKVAARINLEEDVLVQLADRELLIPGKITLIESLAERNQTNYHKSTSLNSNVPINSINEDLLRIIVNVDFSSSELTPQDFCNVGLTAKILINI